MTLFYEIIWPLQRNFNKVIIIKLLETLYKIKHDPTVIHKKDKSQMNAHNFKTLRVEE